VKAAGKLIRQTTIHIALLWLKRPFARVACAKDVAAWNVLYGPSSTKHNFTYLNTTGNSSLCPHIYKWHLLEYLMQALKNSWLIIVKEIKMFQDQGLSIEQMKTHVETGGDLASLPCPQNVNTASKDRDSIPEFSIATFHQFLLSFIVADDQVSGVYLHVFHILFS